MGTQTSKYTSSEVAGTEIIRAQVQGGNDISEFNGVGCSIYAGPLTWEMVVQMPLAEDINPTEMEQGWILTGVRKPKLQIRSCKEIAKLGG